MDVWILPLDGSKPHPFAATPATEVSGRFSPDGRWLSYVSDESGREELFIAPFPGPGEKRQVSKDGAEGSWWLGDGHQIAYMQSSDRKLIVVDLSIRGATLEIGASRTVFGGQSLPEGPLAVTHDGKRLLVGVAVDEAAPAQLEVVSNWTAELRKK
jgi:Tol biopolymer transport system component